MRAFLTHNFYKSINVFNIKNSDSFAAPKSTYFLKKKKMIEAINLKNGFQSFL